MSDTPRTDAAILSAESCIHWSDVAEKIIDFARELERENAKLRQQIEVMTKNPDMLQPIRETLEIARDELLKWSKSGIANQGLEALKILSGGKDEK